MSFVKITVEKTTQKEVETEEGIKKVSCCDKFEEEEELEVPPDNLEDYCIAAWYAIYPIIRKMNTEDIEQTEIVQCGAKEPTTFKLEYIKK